MFRSKGARCFNLRREQAPLAGQDQIDFKACLTPEVIQVCVESVVPACFEGFDDDQIFEEAAEKGSRVGALEFLPLPTRRIKDK